MIRPMFWGALAGACLFVLFLISLPFTQAAEAKGLHPRCNIDFPCVVNSSVTRDPSSRADRFRNVEFGSPMYPPETQRSFLSGTPRFVRGRLVCARNVNAALAARGIRGTGSALAKSFLSWGRASGPTPGAVAVFNRGRRGGHVAIVQEVRSDGTVIYLNPSSRRQAWQVGPYNRRPIAFRVAGT